MKMTWNFFDLLGKLQLKVMDIKEAPNTCGYYLLFGENGEFIYIGKASNLNERLSEHFGRNEQNERIKFLARYAIWEVTTSVEEAENAEGAIYDMWVSATGIPPIANKNKPPKSKLDDNDISKARIKQLLLYMKKIN